MSFAKQLGLPATVSLGGNKITTAHALGRIRPVINALQAEAKTDGEKMRIAEALLMEADRILEEIQ